MRSNEIQKVNEYLTDGEYIDPSILEAFNLIAEDSNKLNIYKTANVVVEVEYSTDDDGNQSQLYALYLYIPCIEDMIKRYIIGRVRTAEEAGVAKAAIMTMIQLL